MWRLWWERGNRKTKERQRERPGLGILGLPAPLICSQVLLSLRGENVQILERGKWCIVMCWRILGEAFWWEMADESATTGNESYKMSEQNGTAEGGGSRSTRNLALRVVNHYQVEILGNVIPLKKLQGVKCCEYVSCAGLHVPLPWNVCGWITGDLNNVKEIQIVVTMGGQISVNSQLCSMTMKCHLYG